VNVTLSCVDSSEWSLLPCEKSTLSVESCEVVSVPGDVYMTSSDSATLSVESCEVVSVPGDVYMTSSDSATLSVESCEVVCAR